MPSLTLRKSANGSASRNGRREKATGTWLVPVAIYSGEKSALGRGIIGRILVGRTVVNHDVAELVDFLVPMVFGVWRTQGI